MNKNIIFNTKIGNLVISFNEKIITEIHFSDSNEKITDTHAPSFVIEASSLLKRMVAGENCHDQLKKVAIDLEPFTPIRRKILELVREIPYGERSSYGEIAHMAGIGKGARYVGQVMANNPFVLIIPCHRVLRKDGSIGGFSAPTGIKLKKKILELEGINRKDFR